MARQTIHKHFLLSFLLSFSQSRRRRRIVAQRELRVGWDILGSDEC